jgi:hypothetical protein
MYRCDLKANKILSIEVTKENVYDGKMLKKLINDNVVYKNNSVNKILADDAMIIKITSGI